MPYGRLYERGYEDMTKRPYQKPVLARLGLLWERTEYSHRNQNEQ
jgi:hypothetical protein